MTHHDSIPWTRTKSLCRVAGTNGVVKLSGVPTGLEISTSDPTGRFRVVATIPSDTGFDTATIPARGLAMIPDDATIEGLSLGNGSLMVETQTTSLRIGLLSDGVPRPSPLPDLVWHPLDSTSLDRILSLASVMEKDRDQVSFRSLVVSSAGSVTGLSSGALVMSGPGIQALERTVLRIPGDYIGWLRGLVKVGSEISWDALGRKLFIKGGDGSGDKSSNRLESMESIQFLAEITLDQEDSPLQRFLDPSIWERFESVLSGPAVIDSAHQDCLDQLKRAVAALGDEKVEISMDERAGDGNGTMVLRQSTDNGEVEERIPVTGSVAGCSVGNISAAVSHVVSSVSSTGSAGAASDGVKIWAGPHVLIKEDSVKVLLLGRND